MSSNKVATISRKINIVSVSRANTTTVQVITNGAHYLKATDTALFMNTYKSEPHQITVSAVSNTTAFTFTVPTNAVYPDAPGILEIPYYSAGQTGPQDSFTIPNFTANATITGTILGANGATYQIEGTSDNIAWANIGSAVTLASSNGASNTIVVSQPYAYVRINPSAIGANCIVKITRVI